jgi:hypothetical protein
MRKIAFVGIILVSLGLLTACGISDDQRAACESSGGVTHSERFIYSSGGFFGDKNTGRLNYCENDGLITEVYNNQITELNTGLFGTNADNTRIFEECNAVEGRTYRTSYTSGKVTYTRYVCIQGGEYLRILE